MYRHCAIKSHVLPGYEIPKFSESDFSQQTLTNKACIRQVGFCAFFKPFPVFGFILLSNLVRARPPAGNAHRWATKIVQKK